MERSLSWIRDNPQLAGISIGGAVVVFVLGLFSFVMLRSGASLRPIIWIAGFFAIVAGPQVVVHLLDGLVLRRARAVEPASPSSSSAVTTAGSGESSSLKPVAWAVVFGPKADPDLITDAKRGLDAILHDADEAKLSFNADGESALAARFPSAEAAAKALNQYGNFFAFAQVSGSDAAGWTARRHAGEGEWVHVVSAGPELYAWTAASRERVIENRTRALGPITDSGSMGGAVAATNDGKKLVSQRLASKTGLMVSILALNVFAASLWFFKGSAWAARVEGSTAVQTVIADSLRRELLALPRNSVPTDVVARPDGTLEVNWRYADARWFDLMQVHQMKRAHRLVLELDESTHKVRVREYWSAFDASAGASGLKLNWQQQTGIQFFAYEHKRVLGAQLDAGGKPTGALSQAYTFDLQAMKRPIVEVVTRAGWTWQPVAWNAPVALRWVTE